MNYQQLLDFLLTLTPEQRLQEATVILTGTKDVLLLSDAGISTEASDSMVDVDSVVMVVHDGKADKPF